jgi:hypothetical protein
MPRRDPRVTAHPVSAVRRPILGLAPRFWSGAGVRGNVAGMLTFMYDKIVRHRRFPGALRAVVPQWRHRRQQ